MERILQHLGLTSKKTSTPYYDQNHHAYPTYGTNRSHVASSTHQSIAKKDRKPRGRGEEDLAWVELTNARDSNDSKGQIIGDTNIVVTTEFGTQFEERGAHHAGSSAASQTSGEDGIGSPRADIRKVV
jgi:hypothetical protein